MDRFGKRATRPGSYMQDPCQRRSLTKNIKAFIINSLASLHLKRQGTGKNCRNTGKICRNTGKNCRMPHLPHASPKCKCKCESFSNGGVGAFLRCRAWLFYCNSPNFSKVFLLSSSSTFIGILYTSTARIYQPHKSTYLTSPPQHQLQYPHHEKQLSSHLHGRSRTHTTWCWCCTGTSGGLAWHLRISHLATPE